jgi:hypothetical protein
LHVDCFELEFGMDKKSLKIPKGYNPVQAIYRKADNTMTKRKRTKRLKEKKKNDLQNITQNANDGASRSPLKHGSELYMNCPC